MQFTFTRSRTKPQIRVGIAGTGFIAMGLIAMVASAPDLTLSRVLTRRCREAVKSLSPESITHSACELADESDVVVECSGDVAHGAGVVEAAFQAGKKVVTMGSEFQVTCGSYFADRGCLSEAEGDQPGSLAALAEDAMSMGFRPLVYGNIKAFLNHEPTREEMHYWSRRNGISLPQVTSFTDGTKLQIEQALVANGLGAGIARQGLLGPQNVPLDVAAGTLARQAKSQGTAISDYVLNRDLPAGVFVVAEHPTERPEVLRYLKLGDGPFYTLLKPFHLCHLEIPKTIRRIAQGLPPLLNNSSAPTVTVAAIAKKDLNPGFTIKQAIGGFAVRGEAASYAQAPDSVPIGMLKDATIVRPVEKGQVLCWDDVEVPESLARTAALAVRDQVLATTAAISSALQSMAV